MTENNWEGRYQEQDTPWDKDEASPGLIDFLSSHTPPERGSVCVPGCGTGHDVRAWRAAGFDVDGFDIAPTAIRLAIQKTTAAGLASQFCVADFLKDPPPRQYDWLFEHTFFCAIQPQQRAAYVEAVLRWLKPAGQLLAVHYLIDDKEGPPFGTTRGEVVERFSSHFDLLQEWVPRSYPNRTGLELMLWWKKK